MGSRTPTSGTGRDEFARQGAKGIKGGTDATFRGFTTVAPSVCVFVQKWQIRRCFPSATGVGEPVKEVRVGWRRRPEGTPTIRCGGSRLPTRGSTTLRFGGSDIATLLGRRHPPGSFRRARPHAGAGQPSIEDSSSKEPLNIW
jgi:hypothetical protein